jgi:hypothetical protein
LKLVARTEKRKLILQASLPVVLIIGLASEIINVCGYKLMEVLIAAVKIHRSNASSLMSGHQPFCRENTCFVKPMDIELDIVVSNKLLALVREAEQGCRWAPIRIQLAGIPACIPDRDAAHLNSAALPLLFTAIPISLKTYTRTSGAGPNCHFSSDIQGKSWFYCLHR